MEALPERQQQSRELSRMDSVYELKYETKEGDDKSVSNKDDSAAVPHNVHKLVAHDATVCFKFLRSLKLEVIMFIYMFSYVIRGISSTTMIVEKVCLVHLGHSEDLCSHLEMNITIKTAVEKLANNYALLHTMIQLLPSAVLACFVGPWSDRYGRKIPIIVALVGIILDGFASIACAAYKYSRVEYYALSGLFTGLSGGIVSVLTIVYSYASDTTTSKNRTLKYTFLELSFGMGIPLGSLAGGWIYKYSSYVYVFMTSVVGHCFGLLWVIYVIEETTGLENKDPVLVQLKSFFSLESLRDSSRSVFKPRPHRARLQIWLLILAMSTAMFSYAATTNINYLFTYHQYNWGNTKYSTVSAIFSIIGMIGILITVPLLTKVFKFGDGALGIIGSVSGVAKNLTISFASVQGLYYLALLFGIFLGIANLAGRSRISKVIPKSDLGKVFSFVSTAESIFPILGTAAFSQMYNMSLNFQFPGLVYLVLGLLMLITLAVYIFFAFLPAVDYDAWNEEDLVHQENKENQE